MMRNGFTGRDMQFNGAFDGHTYANRDILIA